MTKKKLTEAEFFRATSDMIVEAETVQVNEGPFWDAVKTGAKGVGAALKTAGRGVADAMNIKLPPPNTATARNAPSTVDAGRMSQANVAPTQGAQATQTANPAPTKNAAVSDPYENLKGQVRQLQAKPGARALPAKMVTDLNAMMARLAKGDKDSGAYAADKIIKFATAGYDVTRLQPQWIASAKQGERFLTQSVYRQISRMLSEHGLTWASLGLKIRLDESIGSNGVFISRK